MGKKGLRTQVGLGPARVDGVLSVSRAFGDFMLAPRVTWHPYQAERRLTPADEFVVLGCDGVFDVLDDQTVVDIGREALDAGKTPALCGYGSGWAWGDLRSPIKNKRPGGGRPVDEAEACAEALGPATAGLMARRT